jgi:transketolase
MSTSHELRDPVAMSAQMRRTVIDMAGRSRSGHIGSALSIVDLLAVLYAAVLDPERDRLVLSKGHAVAALYAALFAVGVLDEAAIASYCAEGSALGEHPEHEVPGVTFSTGSLGLGLSYGAGVALASRLSGSERRCFVVMSDAELNEGAVWEAVMFAAHRHLGNLVAIVDVNEQQALGRTEEILSLDPIGTKWAAFGWEVIDLDGHDHVALLEALTDRSSRSPTVVLARTTFAKGVPFMERQLGWHYWSMNDQQYRDAIEALAGGERL